MSAIAELPYTLLPLTPHFGTLVEARAHQPLTELDTTEIARLFVKSGALVFRGFSVDTQSFLAFSSVYCRTFMTYQGGGLRYGALDRESIGGNPTLLSTTGHTQGFPIDLHGEMYYMKRRPDVLWFFCENAPATAGETTLCDGVELLRRLSPETQRFLSTHRLRYLRRLADGEWQTTFQTQDLDEVRKICAENDTSLRVQPEGGIETEFASSPLSTSPTAKAEVFINNLLLIYKAEQAFESGWVKQNLTALKSQQCPMVIRLEDDSRFPEAMFEEIRRASKKITLAHVWRTGDIMMIDNTRLLHGRKESVGKDRAIYVRMAEFGQPLQAALGQSA